MGEAFCPFVQAAFSRMAKSKPLILLAGRCLEGAFVLLSRFKGGFGFFENRFSSFTS